MRIVDGLINDPKLIFGGWIFSIIIIFLHVGKKEEFDIHEFSLNASLGAYVLVIQMLLFRVIPPFPGLPVHLAISGVSLVVLVAKPRTGILISSAAIILNHLLYPGAVLMMGINLMNMIIASYISTYFPSKIFHNKNSGRRIRYTMSFFSGFSYTIIIVSLIFIELSFYFNSDTEFTLIVVGIIIWILLISLIEGLLTGIASSYYSSQRNYDEKDELSNHKFREEIIDDPTEYLMEFEDDEEDY